MSGSLIKRSRAAMLLAAGAMALTLVSAGGAQAAPAAERCTIKSYTPAKFVVAATDTQRQFKVKTTGCTQKNWRVDLLVDDEPVVVLATKAKPVSVLFPKELDNTLAGRYKVLITVKSTDNKVTKKKFFFSLLRRSTFGTSFNVGPEPAAPGATLTVLGTLKRVSWGENPSYVPYANRTVRVQFRASGTKKFVNVATATTDANGNVSTTVTPSGSGTWRMFFAGNAATGAAVSAVDGVRVG
jgi:hypothetical protein